MKHTRRQWSLFDSYRITKEMNPYLDRFRIIQTPLISLYIHRIHTADVDEFPHDHPWWFCSFILSGDYVERVYKNESDLSDFRQYHRLKFSIHFMGRKEAHKITRITKVLRTLVITGPHQGSWHFWTPEGLIYWEDITGSENT